MRKLKRLAIFLLSGAVALKLYGASNEEILETIAMLIRKRRSKPKVYKHKKDT